MGQADVSTVNIPSVPYPNDAGSLKFNLRIIKHLPLGYREDFPQELIDYQLFFDKAGF
jgi:hypothetical protein